MISVLFQAVVGLRVLRKYYQSEKFKFSNLPPGGAYSAPPPQTSQLKKSRFARFQPTATLYVIFRSFLQHRLSCLFSLLFADPFKFVSGFFTYQIDPLFSTTT